MKYKVTKIYEDKEILKNIKVTELSKLMGCDHSHASRIKAGKITATQKFYNELCKKLGKEEKVIDNKVEIVIE